LCHIDEEITAEKFELIKVYIDWNELAEVTQASVSFEEAKLNPQTPETTLQSPVADTDTTSRQAHLPSSESVTPPCRDEPRT
jgi:hypothetical protein